MSLLNPFSSPTQCLNIPHSASNLLTETVVQLNPMTCLLNVLIEPRVQLNTVPDRNVMTQCSHLHENEVVSSFCFINIKVLRHKIN